tara:strand:- start:440 stop:613 length:174 start_codon:yes stop_codon:yes gene_type:complete
MPNHWMDQIVKILDDFYEDKYQLVQLLAKINIVSIDYKEEFKRYDNAITAEAEERNL